MKIVILDRLTLGNDIPIDSLNACGEVFAYDTTKEEQVEERIKDAEVIITNKMKLRENVLKTAASLKLICVTATGYDNIDLPYCKTHGVAVCNVAGYSTQSVAQCTIAMVLNLAMHFEIYKNYVSSGFYLKNGVANILTPTYPELYNKTWGIIGYGNIGKQVAKVAEAMGCHLLIYRKHPTNDPRCVSLEELCQKSDIISVHVPLNNETNQLITKKEISLMKNNVILVNQARGAVVSEEDIKNAILENRIGAFGTDVYTQEPFPENHPLYAIKDRENVCLTPHMSWGAYEARVRLIDEVCENIKAYYHGERRSRVD